MATFSDVGKDISDQFSKDFANAQNVELSAKVNDYFSFLLKGAIKGNGVVAGTFAPTIKVPDYKLEIKPELITKDDKDKTYKVDVSFNDVLTSGLKAELGTSNGKEGELFLGLAYKNAKFGGVTARVTFPEGKDKFITPSVYLETPDTKGFGVGGTAKVVVGDNAKVESWKVLGSYKKSGLSTVAGVESKLDKPKPAPKPAEGEKPAVVAPTSSIYLSAGVLKNCNCNTAGNTQVGANAAFNVSQQSLDLEVLFRKNYTDGTFLKIKGNLDGTATVSKQFKPQAGTTLVLGTNVNVFTGKGNAGFQFSTAL